MTKARTIADQADGSAYDGGIYAGISFAPQVCALDAPVSRLAVTTVAARRPAADEPPLTGEQVEDTSRPRSGDREAFPVASATARGERRSRLRAAHLESLARAGAEAHSGPGHGTEEFIAALRAEFARVETRTDTKKEVRPDASAERASLVGKLLWGRASRRSVAVPEDSGQAPRPGA